MFLLTESSLLSLFRPLLCDFLLGLYLQKSVILLHDLLSVDEFFEIFMAVYPLDLWFNNYIVLNDLFHSDVGLVLGVVGWPNAVEMRSVLEGVA